MWCFVMLIIVFETTFTKKVQSTVSRPADSSYQQLDSYEALHEDTTKTINSK